MRSAVSAAVFLALLAFGGGVGAQTTDLLLVLAADVSRSIDESEFALQRKGYSAALTDPRVLAAIRGGAPARSRSALSNGPAPANRTSSPTGR